MSNAYADWMHDTRNAGSICAECARAAGGRWMEGHAATQWVGTCEVCDKEKPCCAGRDWLWGKETEISLERWD